MSIRDDVIFSLEVHGDIEFTFQGQSYYIGYNNNDATNDDNGYVILLNPDTQVAISHSDSWLDALDQPIFDGKAINDVFDQIDFTQLI